ncbi:MAG: DUF4344 domain-containing metallopeptidase [Granulosicoccus sp.]
MNESPKVIVGVALAILLVSACGGGDSGDSFTFVPSNDSSPSVSGESIVQPQSDLAVSTTTALSRDNFSFQIDEQFSTEQSEFLIDSIQREVGAAVVPLNSVANVLADNTVSVMYGSCGVANAFYSPLTREIFMCHELTVVAFDLFRNGGDTDDNTAFTFAQEAIIHVMYHEMGHALDDLTGLNVGGNFESVADAIAVVLAVQTGQPRVAVLGGSLTLASGESSLFDEHGSGVDRGGDILCWALGGSPELAINFADLSADFVDAGRDCAAEYANQFAFVETLIPELRNVPTVGATRIAPSQAERDIFVQLDEKLSAMLEAR